MHGCGNTLPASRPGVWVRCDATPDSRNCGLLVFKLPSDLPQISIFFAGTPGASRRTRSGPCSWLGSLGPGRIGRIFRHHCRNRCNRHGSFHSGSRDFRHRLGCCSINSNGRGCINCLIRNNRRDFRQRRRNRHIMIGHAFCDFRLQTLLRSLNLAPRFADNKAA